MTQKTLFDEPEVSESFDGASFSKPLDGKRLTTQLHRVRTLMSDGEWRTLAEIHRVVGGSEAGVSARLRDWRKKRFGSLAVQRRRRCGGLWEYRIGMEGQG